MIDGYELRGSYQGNKTQWKEKSMWKLVKTRHAKNNLRKKHADTNFTFATKQYLKNIATTFGPIVLSIDDKTIVPIRITAATKQTPIVMFIP